MDELTKAEEIAKGALGIDWWDTESAARRVAEHAAELIAEQLEKQTYTYYGKDGRPVLARDLEDRLEAANARISDLEEVLEPFADAANEMARYDDYNQAPVTVGQCRVARVALDGEIATEKNDD